MTGSFSRLVYKFAAIRAIISVRFSGVSSISEMVFPSGMPRSRAVAEFTAMLRREATMERLLPDLP